MLNVGDVVCFCRVRFAWYKPCVGIVMRVLPSDAVVNWIVVPPDSRGNWQNIHVRINDLVRIAP